MLFSLTLFFYLCDLSFGFLVFLRALLLWVFLPICFIYDDTFYSSFFVNFRVCGLRRKQSAYFCSIWEGYFNQIVALYL